MRVAIVGSRDFQDLVAVHDYVAALPLGTVVVSGGARGVDTAAREAAKALGFAFEEFPADWNLHGRRAGMIRNAAMIETCDRVAAFWNGRSRGTDNAIKTARRLGKPVSVFGDRLEEWLGRENANS